MTRTVLTLLLLAGCAAKQPEPPAAVPFAVEHPSTPGLVAASHNAAALIAPAIKGRDDLSNTDLLTIMRLGDEMHAAVRAWQSRPTQAHATAAREAIGKLRGFLGK